MTSEQWQRVKELFEASLERDETKRTAFLLEICPEDAEIRVEVQSLLAAHDRDSGFLNQPAGNLLPDEEPILLSGQRLGTYEILSPLGKGGMGQVYLAIDNRLGRRVALKFLPSSYSHDSLQIQRLEQEARAASALNHPNIVTIHEIGEAQSIHFIATEFVDGITLRQRMTQSELTVREIVDIGTQIASALRAAHNALIVHRDIKPENVMLRGDGVVKVLDFGLAKQAGQQLSFALGASANSSMVNTDHGVIMGTTAYMSPEQARGEKVDARTDVWSLAVVIYEMIHGRAPFNGETHRQIVTAILENEVPKLETETVVPDELNQILTKALSKDRAKRYENASAMANELKSLQGELEVRARLELKNNGQNDAARRIGLTTLPHLPTVTTGSRYARRNTNKYLQLIRHHKILAGIALILFASTMGWLYIAKDRNEVSPSLINKRSIAVLPPTPINSVTRDDVYEIGIADALIRKLGELNGVVVRQLSSIRGYTDPVQDPIAAGKEQRVDYVLSSQYQFLDKKIRINAQLFNVATGQAEKTYQIEKEASDVLAVQEAIAQDIGNKLLAQFATTFSLQTVKRGTTNEKAYRLYLQGMYLANMRNLEDAEKAITSLEQAVALDPNYARAWAGLGYAHRTLSVYGSKVSTRETYQKSIEAISKALALDQNLSEAHSALCENKYLFEWDFVGAEQECKLAIQLDPNSSQAHEIYSRYLMGRGRHEEALASIKTAIDVEPTSKFNQLIFGRVLFCARRYEEAEDQFKRVLAMDQNWRNTYKWLISTLALQGNEDEAFEWFNRLLSLRKVDDQTVQLFKSAFQTSGWHGVWREWVIHSDKIGGTVFERGVYSAQIGDTDRALEYLEQVYKRKEIWNTYLRVDPRLDPLRDDPRFVDLLRRVEGK